MGHHEKIIWKFGNFRRKKIVGDFYSLGNPAFSPLTRKNLEVLPGGEARITLPRYLTGNIERHEGVESLTFLCRLEPGFYRLTISFYEWAIKAMRNGPNAEWDNDKTVTRKFASRTVRYELNPPLVKKWDSEVTAAVKSRELPGKTLTFEEVDEYANQPDRNVVFAYLDGREIGTFAECYPEILPVENDVAVARCVDIPFVCETGGYHRITLEAPRVPTWPRTGGTAGRYSGQRFVLNGISLSRTKTPEPAHSLKSGFPIRANIDLWGWELGLSYQRKDWNHPPKPAYFRKVVDEAARWGANFVEFYTSHCLAPRSAPFEWKEDNRFLYHPSPGWTNSAFHDFTRHCHKCGVMLHWYMHWPFEDKSAALTYWEAPAEWVEKLNEKIAGDFADSVSLPWENILDGLHYESAGYSTSADMLREVHPLWESNPTMNYVETGTIRRRRVLPALFPGTLGYTTCNNRGYDDLCPMNPFGERHLQSEFGRSFIGGQLNCRDQYYNQYGDINPDFILKQINDAVRDYNLNASRRYVGGFWWLGEPPATTSSQARRAVYIASLDPLRCAVATTLSTTGKGGAFSQRLAQTQNRDIYRPSVNYPASTTFVQNNWVRLYSDQGKDGFDLWSDPTGTAEYDDNSQALCIGKGFLSTVSSACLEGLEKIDTIIEPGGYRSILSCSIDHRINDPDADFNEKKRLTVDADCPFLRAVIKRRHKGAQYETATIFPSKGYDQLWIDGKKVRYNPVGKMIGDIPAPESFQTEKNPGYFELIDSTGIRPRLGVFVVSRGNIGKLEWYPDGDLMLWSLNRAKYTASDVNYRIYHPVVSEREELEFVVTVGDSLWKRRDNPQLRKFFAKTDRDLTMGKRRKLSVPNKLPIPQVQIVKINDPDGKPYSVCENGWWISRGAQPSFHDNDRKDYLKLYLPPNGTAVIHRDALIDGIARTGWGCQYTLAIKDPLKKTRDGAIVTARVLGINTFIFAPRVEFTRTIKAARLDGKPWYYFDDKIVFLPNAVGDYRVKVTYGKCSTPAISRTHARITETVWMDNTFSFEASLPEYQKKLPPSILLYALIVHDRPIVKAKGAKLVKNGLRGSIIAFKLGKISIMF